MKCIVCNFELSPIHTYCEQCGSLYWNSPSVGMLFKPNEGQLQLLRDRYSGKLEADEKKLREELEQVSEWLYALVSGVEVPTGDDGTRLNQWWRKYSQERKVREAAKKEVRRSQYQQLVQGLGDHQRALLREFLLDEEGD